MAVEIVGIETLIRRMEALKQTSKVSVMRSAIRGGLNAIGKQMKADLDPKAKQGKVAVKSRFKKGKKRITAKVGFGVGKKGAYKEKKRTKKSGVGISGNNIHWWVAGTMRRTTGFRTRINRKTGRITRTSLTDDRSEMQDRGVMPAMQPKLASIAYAKSKGKVKAEMIKRGALQLEKEAKKLQRIN